MNNIKNTLIDYFSQRIYEVYMVTGNHARFLFDRWNILDLEDKTRIKNFLLSGAVRKVFYITSDLNLAKKYNLEELKKLGINLVQLTDETARVYRDDKCGFIWHELFNGMGDCYTGLFMIKTPLPVEDLGSTIKNLKTSNKLPEKYITKR